MAVTQTSPHLLAQARTSPSTLGKNTEIYLQEYNHTVQSFECLDWKVTVSMVPVVIATLQITVWKSNLIHKCTEFMLLILTKPLKIPQQLQNSVVHTMFPEGWFDKHLLTDFYNSYKMGFSKKINLTARWNSFYWLTTGLWSQISLTHHRYWNIFPSHPETEMSTPSCSRETNVPLIHHRQRWPGLLSQLYTHSLFSSLQQLKCSQTKFSCAHKKCILLREGRQAASCAGGMMLI